MPKPSDFDFDPMFTGNVNFQTIPHPAVLYKAPNYGAAPLEPCKTPDALWVVDQTTARTIEQGVMSQHILYETSDKDAPDTIKDRNGEVVLGLCKICGRGEAQLIEACEPKIEYVTGYPFMRLAKRHGVDYGDVLNWAQNSDPNLPEYTLSTNERFRLYQRLSNAAEMDIEKLMDLPVVLRGSPYVVNPDGSRTVVDADWLHAYGHDVV